MLFRGFEKREGGGWAYIYGPVPVPAFPAEIQMICFLNFLTDRFESTIKVFFYPGRYRMIQEECKLWKVSSWSGKWKIAWLGWFWGLHVVRFDSLNHVIKIKFIHWLKIRKQLNLEIKSLLTIYMFNPQIVKNCIHLFFTEFAQLFISRLGAHYYNKIL